MSFNDVNNLQTNVDLEYLPKNQIQIQGEVRRPGVFQYKLNADVLDYIELAGGLNVEPSGCNLRLVRNYGKKNRSLLFKLDQSNYIPRLKQGDILIISASDSENVNKAYHKPSIKPATDKNILRQDVTENNLSEQDFKARQVLENYILLPQFKRIVNQIASFQAGTGNKSLAIISAHACEGKSFFCAALALAYSRFLDSQVLIIDTNRLNSSSNLFDSISGDYSSQVPRRDLHNLPSYIDLTRIEEIESDYHQTSDFYIRPYIQSVADQYDLILVDTCACSQVSSSSVDPMIVASQVESVLVVTSPLSLDKDMIFQLSSDLKNSGCSVVGTIFNPFIKD